ncbi:hypothetical protein [Synechococcus sp. PCC 7502]|uniref:hypothetical protein n=1 Tax=Synechococcus sp. PCC 7502 TaxID=1173263 RepID=UPI00059E8114|nr:hypothetical protein [Synechococcus sp. PCC 7502]
MYTPAIFFFELGLYIYTICSLYSSIWYKSGAFKVTDSHLRNPQALTCLFMLLDTASLIALILGIMLVRLGHRAWLDWHHDRGLSFLQIGLRELQRLLYQGLLFPQLQILPKFNPLPACASQSKRELLDYRIEFSRVTTVSS